MSDLFIRLAQRMANPSSALRPRPVARYEEAGALSDDPAPVGPTAGYQPEAASASSPPPHDLLSAQQRPTDLIPRLSWSSDPQDHQRAGSIPPPLTSYQSPTPGAPDPAASGSPMPSPSSPAEAVPSTLPAAQPRAPRQSGQGSMPERFDDMPLASSPGILAGPGLAPAGATADRGPSPRKAPANLPPHLPPQRLASEAPESAQGGWSMPPPSTPAEAVPSPPPVAQPRALRQSGQGSMPEWLDDMPLASPPASPQETLAGPRLAPAGATADRGPSPREAPANPARRESASPSAPPIIHVTIGRVEVRAHGGGTPPPPQRRDPALSLDDYLRRRTEGTL